MKTNFGLSKDTLDDIEDRLAALTSDLHILYVKTLRCHWNLEDPRFFFLHEFLDAQYHQLAEDVDLVAERIRAIGRKAPGSLREFLELGRLPELASDPDADPMLSALAESYEQLILLIRHDIEALNESGDPGTVDMLTQLLRQYEKTTWMLRSHLNGSHFAQKSPSNSSRTLQRAGK